MTNDCPKQTVPDPIIPPKKVDIPPKPNKSQPLGVDKDGFKEVNYRKSAKKNVVPVKERKKKVFYQPINYQKMVGGASSSNGNGKVKDVSSTKCHNPYDALNGLVNEDLSDLEGDVDYGDPSGASTSLFGANG